MKSTNQNGADRRDSTQAALSRREFIASAAVSTAALASMHGIARAAWAGGGETIHVGVIGCGGRGTGAAINALEADPATRIVALADLFPDRLESSRNYLASDERFADRAKVEPDRCFTGFDAYQKLLATDVDVVILATPPHFRPIHFRAAVDAGKHVFMEKPVAVDAWGVNSVIQAGADAAAAGLSVVAGTQRRHEASYLAAMDAMRSGDFGRIISARCYWNQGGLWVHHRKPEYSDMEWQCRNWLYFCWLSGDHIVEQHVHNLDVINWALGATPLRCLGMGGRQVRTGPEYGNIYDHFAVEYIYPGDVHVLSMARQIEGTAFRCEEVIHATGGVATLRPGFAAIGATGGGNDWRFSERNNNPYVQEHADLFAAIRSGKPINEARQVAESTLTAIMGRESAYTGQEITWEQMLASTRRLAPPAYEFGDLPVDEVPVPGRTKFE
mgnify:CR=1 FL=1|jgi:predicted dehydrogenase